MTGSGRLIIVINWVTRHQTIFLSSLQCGAVPVRKFPDDDGPSVRQFLTDGPLFSVFHAARHEVIQQC